MKQRRTKWVNAIWGLGPIIVLASCGQAFNLGQDVSGAGAGGRPSDTAARCLGGANSCAGAAGTLATSSSATEGDQHQGGQPPGGITGGMSSVHVAGSPPEVATTGGAGGAGGADSPTLARFEARDCEDTPFELDPERVRFCVTLSGCTGSEQLWGCISSQDFVSYEEYYLPQFLVSRPREPELPLSACPQSIASCDDVLQCAGFRLPITECLEDQEARCEGELAINCAHGVGVTDCQRSTGKAGTCRVVGDRAHCIVADTCSDPTNKGFCQGDVRTRCVDGVAEGLNCADFGLVCNVNVGFNSNAQCVHPPPSETCELAGRVYCDGDSPAYCNPEGLLFKSPECSLNGDLSCSISGEMMGTVVECLRDGCSADSLEEQIADCDGDDAVSGNDYFQVRVHCPDYGFSTCTNNHCSN